MARGWFGFEDALGPERVLHLWHARVGLEAVVVVDNTACGPAIGGVRMAPDVSTEECFRLARAMTFKNAAAGLRHGGGKAVIRADPAMPLAQKERLLRAFACAIRDLEAYIPGPDMGTDERAMAWVRDEIGRAVGLPRELGGIPLDEIGATGHGLAVACEVACRFAGIALEKARVAIQGFGAVGRHAARRLAERGCRIVAVSDSKGTLLAEDGLDVPALLAHKAKGAPVAAFPGGRAASSDAIVAVECDIWIPAARPDVIHEGNVDRLRTKIVVSGANIPITPAAEAALEARGVLQVPDFIANAGGVICAAVEYAGGSEAEALAVIAEKIRANTEAVLERAYRERIPARRAAEELARERIEKAMDLRRFG
ncbi:MAG: Glu/Leu/Phe/Val dehydrogenase [Geminicoccaceae bacterium]|nr:Glu/Leu/Phe/Val dehydrogenase [Geminicoccaceae bacterium]MDW8125151.1 Glu/Leu/Phe/Val dehydrogenase [Geminicoccaceae bacterium]MDW8340926.1 Glu/Leu/Phe/Val dehydrogenase [Geminicoccaceae bacterium]